MSTLSVVSQNMQVCKGNEEEIVDHNTTILDERSEKVIDVDNQFITTPSLNQGNDGGKNSEIQSTVHAPSSNLKGNENNLNLNLQNKLVRNCDDPFVSSGIEHTQTLCADSIDSYINTSAENL